MTILHPRLRPRRGGLALGAASAITSAIVVLGSGGSGAAQGITEMVKTICLTAFQAEMQAAGKTAPAGMADYACGCVAERISEGDNLLSAQDSCRQMASKRYPL